MDDLNKTSKGENLEQNISSDDKRQVETTSRSRYRNLTQSQRDSLARHLRRCRQAHFLEMRSGLTETFEDRTGRSVGSIFSKIWNPSQATE